MAQPIHTHLPKTPSVQSYGKKKHAIATALVTQGKGMIRVNGVPLQIVEPPIMRVKVLEPILLLGESRFSKIDIKIKVKSGGYTSQIYAIRQAIAKGIVAFYQKFIDEDSKRKIKEMLFDYDRTLLVADPRRKEPKKFGGHGARARRQKSYR